MRKPKLHQNWKQSWKWFSVQAMGAAASLQLLWANLPDGMKASLSPKMVSWITGAVLVAGMLGRIIQQASDGE